MSRLFFFLMLLGASGPTFAGARHSVSDLDRVSHAVDGAESSHGTHPAMWRPEAAGPQGPMQVTEKAAIDVGGGDRFDITQNRAIGRAYLSLLYRRYGNWPDAVAAYNWGLGRLDLWIRAGRPPEKLVPGVSRYARRVLHDSGLCSRAAATPECFQGSTSSLAERAGRQPSAFNRNLAKAERLAAQFGRAGY